MMSTLAHLGQRVGPHIGFEQIVDQDGGVPRGACIGVGPRGLGTASDRTHHPPSTIQQARLISTGTNLREPSESGVWTEV